MPPFKLHEYEAHRGTLPVHADTISHCMYRCLDDLHGFVTQCLPSSGRDIYSVPYDRKPCKSTLLYSLFNHVITCLRVSFCLLDTGRFMHHSSLLGSSTDQSQMLLIQGCEGHSPGISRMTHAHGNKCISAEVEDEYCHRRSSLCDVMNSQKLS